MIRGTTDNGSQYIGLVPGELVDRLMSGAPVALPAAPVLGLGRVWLTLDRSVEDVNVLRSFSLSGEPVISLYGREIAERLLAGDRVCLEGAGRHPHVCLFYRANNRELLEALDEYFPGVVPGAPHVHMGNDEPTGVAR